MPKQFRGTVLAYSIEAVTLYAMKVAPAVAWQKDAEGSVSFDTSRTNVESSTAGEKVSMMDALSTTGDVNELGRRIDQILELLRIQNSLLCQLLPQSAKISSDLKELAGMESKLNSIDNALCVLEEFIRLK